MGDVGHERKLKDNCVGREEKRIGHIFLALQTHNRKKETVMQARSWWCSIFKENIYVRRNHWRIYHVSRKLVKYWKLETYTLGKDAGKVNKTNWKILQHLWVGVWLPKASHILLGGDLVEILNKLCSWTEPKYLRATLDASKCRSQCFRNDSMNSYRITKHLGMRNADRVVSLHLNGSTKEKANYIN